MHYCYTVSIGYQAWARTLLSGRFHWCSCHSAGGRQLFEQKAGLIPRCKSFLLFPKKRLLSTKKVEIWQNQWWACYKSYIKSCYVPLQPDTCVILNVFVTSFLIAVHAWFYQWQMFQFGEGKKRLNQLISTETRGEGANGCWDKQVPSQHCGCRGEYVSS